MRVRKIHPYILIISSFVSVILLGTLLLLLPISAKDGNSIGFIDSLFMSTSAVCVTGLATVSVANNLSVFGQIVMCVLMEIGGLSIITIAVFIFAILGAKIGVSNRILIKEALNQNSVKGVIGLVKKIIFTTLIIQGVGTIINLIALMPHYDYNFGRSLYVSIFHTVASFNNAGFDIFGDDSMIGFSSDVLLNATTMILIVLGGIGFIVIDDIIRKRRWKRLTLHTKLTLIITAILIIGGALLFRMAQSNATWMQSFFTSITCRTAGFATFDMAELSNGGYLICVGLMFIGASPCSTGGGIKTTTIIVILIAIYHFATGKTAKAFGRKIPNNVIFMAFVLYVIAFIFLVVGIFVVACIEADIDLKKIIFECVSAFSTTGLSMGITKSLSIGSKLVLCVLMLFGRLGPLTIIGVVNKNWMNESRSDIKYVEEGVYVG